MLAGLKGERGFSFYGSEGREGLVSTVLRGEREFSFYGSEGRERF